MVSASTRLFLSALAAMLNTWLTLPIDVISTRHQVSNLEGHRILSRTSSIDSSDAYIFYDASNSSQEDDEIDRPTHSIDPKVEDGQFPMNDSITLPFKVGRISTIPETGWRYRWCSLWKGLLPSLLLCTNPAIHFTVYDVARTRFLQGRSSDKQRRLSMMEAFLLGLLAKFVATVATYPLIQAKVKLMTASNNDNNTMLTCLHCEYERNGIKGLYRGCDLQLMHTLLKSALLMMLRERITRTTRQWLLATGRTRYDGDRC